LARARPWIVGLAILAAFMLGVILLLAALDVLWGMHELIKNAPPPE
jgi:hypothetical protein